MTHVIATEVDHPEISEAKDLFELPVVSVSMQGYSVSMYVITLIFGGSALAASTQYPETPKSEVLHPPQKLQKGPTIV